MCLRPMDGEGHEAGTALLLLSRVCWAQPAGGISIATAADATDADAVGGSGFGGGGGGWTELARSSGPDLIARAGRLKRNRLCEPRPGPLGRRCNRLQAAGRCKEPQQCASGRPGSPTAAAGAGMRR